MAATSTSLGGQRGLYRATLKLPQSSHAFLLLTGPLKLALCRR